MKLEKTAMIAEIIGGIAIVVTLLILIVEVRGNTEAVRAQTAQATFGISAESFYYPEGNIALDKMMSGTEELTDDEISHATSLLAAIWTTFDNHYYQYRHGNLDEEIHEAYRARLEFMVSNPAARANWQQRKSLSTAAFREYVDEIIENLE